VLGFLLKLLRVLIDCCRSRQDLALENLVLRHQLQPETVIGWHRRGWRPYWSWRSRSRLGRPRQIVAYCRGPYRAFAPEAVRTLRAHGYAASHLRDGLPEWAAASNNVESVIAGASTVDR
jgi:rhodanese-related sulfurtransferase